MAIGAALNDGNGNYSGHVRVYQYNVSTSNWDQKGFDIDGEAAEDLSGGSVSLSGDGSILAIGARDNDGNGSDSGHVRVYQFIEDALSINPKEEIEGLILTVVNGVVKSNLENVSLTIYNLVGQQVANQNLQGIYIVKVIDANGNERRIKMLVH